MVINKNFGEGEIKEGENVLGYWDHFLVFLFLVNKDENVTYPFVFADDRGFPSIYAVSNGKDHLEEAVPLDVSSCE